MKSGLCWHVHHDILLEYCWDFDRRVEYIKSSKPPEEVETRLRLMKPVEGALGDAKARAEYDKARSGYAKARSGYDKAEAEYDKAWAEYDKARAEYDKAWAEYAKARAEYDKARAEYAKARAAFLNTIKPGEAEALHAVECPGCPWDGNTIFPEVKQS